MRDMINKEHCTYMIKPSSKSNNIRGLDELFLICPGTGRQLLKGITEIKLNCLVRN